jgi:hypothetical protein
MSILAISTFFKSSLGKYISIGVIILALIGYHNFTVWSLEDDIKDLNLDLKRTELNLDTANTNLDTCKITNNENISVLDDYSKDILILRQNQKATLDGKDKLILSLKNTIKNMRVEVIYPETIEYKECKLKIKTIKDYDENSSNNTLNNLNHIGF